MLRRAWVGVGLLTLVATPVSVADAQVYVYERGKNQVDVPGSRCVVASAGSQSSFIRPDGFLRADSASTMTRTVFCPINRRSLAYYAKASGSNLKTVSAQRVTVRVRDEDPGRSFSCTPFTKSNLGSVAFGPTRFACSTFQGCTTDPGGSFVGNQLLNFTSVSSTNTVQWGVSCAVPPGSDIHYFDAIVNPNLE